MQKMIDSIYANINAKQSGYANLREEGMFSVHADLLLACANQMLAEQGKQFVEDDNNLKVLKFLLLYFNNDERALKVFPEMGHDLRKNILLCGDVGVGKTLIMDAIALYLNKTNNPRAFKTTSQTQMLNYYKQHNTLDLYTYNENGSHTFEGNPHNLCVNDLGLSTQKFYGQDTKAIIEEFIYARYEIWANKGKFTHLTTNLDTNDIKTMFSDEYGRIQDRFKGMYNIVPLGGTSRR